MKTELEQSVASAVKDVFDIDARVELTRPDEQFGDYSTNVALQLSKQLGKNPREIADTLAAHVRGLSSHIAEVTVAGPGFLNLTLTESALAGYLSRPVPQPLLGQKILVEYSDPNPFKPLHAGHLYATLVGDVIARLVQNAGADIVRINYGGDVGLHVGKCMWSILKVLGGEFPEKLTDISESDRPAWLGSCYVAGTNAYEEDESAKAEIIALNKRVYQLHERNDHDSPFAQIYWTCRQWSYDYFKTLYTQLQVTPFDRYIPESEVTPLGLQEVTEQLAHGTFKYGDQQDAEATDATRPIIFEPADESLHARVFINSAGLPTYETKDVGLSITKWNDYAFDQSIITTDFSQAQYMQVVLAAIRCFAPKPADRTRHLTHGRVKLIGGVKISSRKGNGPSALDILESARIAGQESGTNLNEDTILAAVKYAFSKVRIGGDIVYDPKESIALEGNSGPYLQYAHARACSIISRHSELVSEPQETTSGILKVIQNDGGLQPDERNLLRKITEYQEIVSKATADLMPHYICTYLYELAQKFNQFYEHNRVIGDKRQAIRLQLVAYYADTLKTGLNLLGITAPDKM